VTYIDIYKFLSNYVQGVRTRCRGPSSLGVSVKKIPITIYQVTGWHLEQCLDLHSPPVRRACSIVVRVVVYILSFSKVVPLLLSFGLLHTSSARFSHILAAPLGHRLVFLLACTLVASFKLLRVGSSTSSIHEL